MITDEGWIAVGIGGIIVALFLVWLIRYNCGYICCPPEVDGPVNNVPPTMRY